MILTPLDPSKSAAAVYAAAGRSPLAGCPSHPTGPATSGAGTPDDGTVPTAHRPVTGTYRWWGITRRGGYASGTWPASTDLARRIELFFERRWDRLEVWVGERYEGHQVGGHRPAPGHGQADVVVGGRGVKAKRLDVEAGSAVGVWFVASPPTPGVWRRVQLVAEGQWVCTCPWGTERPDLLATQPCAHVAAVQENGSTAAAATGGRSSAVAGSPVATGATGSTAADRPGSSAGQGGPAPSGVNAAPAGEGPPVGGSRSS